MQVERLFTNYRDANNVELNDVQRKADTFWHNSHRIRKGISRETQESLLGAVYNDTEFTGDILGVRNIVVFLIIPNVKFSIFTGNVEGECLFFYRTSRKEQDITHYQKVGVIPLHKEANQDSFETYKGKNFNNYIYLVEAYHFEFKDTMPFKEMANKCRAFFHVDTTNDDQHVTFKKIEKWKNHFMEHMATVKSDLIKDDLLTPANLDVNHIIILLFIGRTWWKRWGATKEHAAMFYRTQVQTGAGVSEKVVYVSLYPKKSLDTQTSKPNDPSALLYCYTPDFHSFGRDFNDLLQGGANKNHDVEAYRITLNNQEEIVKIHDAYRKYLLNTNDHNVQFDRWSLERPSAYLPNIKTQFFMCYWAMGCAWLACCFTKPKVNCVSLIVNLLGAVNVYTSASAWAQYWTGVAHILIILSIGSLCSEFSRIFNLFGVEYPVENADTASEIGGLVIFACVLMSFATYALDIEIIQQYLPSVFKAFCLDTSLVRWMCCCGYNLLNPENVGTLPKSIYLMLSIISFIIAFAIFIARGQEHGFSDQFDNQQHVFVIWGVFFVASAISFIVYSLLTCCASETLSCSRPVTLHRDLRRMTLFSSRRTVGLTFTNYQPPTPSADLETGQQRNARMSHTSEFSDGEEGSGILLSSMSILHATSPSSLPTDIDDLKTNNQSDVAISGPSTSHTFFSSISKADDIKGNQTHFSIDGLSYQQIPGDGSCLYNAIGLYLGQDAQSIRNIVANNLEHNNTKYESIVKGLLGPGKTFENYVTGIRNSEWGDDLEIGILMQLLGRAILVVRPNGSIDHRDAVDTYSGDPIFVFYNGINHYDALVRNSDLTGRQILGSINSSSTISIPNGSPK